MKNKVSRVVQIGLLALFLLSIFEVGRSIYFANQNQLVEASWFGFKPVIHQGDNMKPDIHRFDTLVVYLESSPNSFREGDYIYFTSNDIDRSVEKVVRQMTDGSIETQASSLERASNLLLDETHILGKVLFVIPSGQPVFWVVLVLGVGGLTFLTHHFYRDKKHQKQSYNIDLKDAHSND